MKGIIVSQSNTRVIHRDGHGITIFLGHGTGDKKYGGNPEILLSYDYHFISGPKHLAKLEDVGIRIPEDRLIPIGNPRFDNYLSNVGKEKSYLRYLGVREISQPTVLYAPTFSKRYTSSSDLFHEIKVLQNQDWQWIAKFHDLEEKDVIKQYELFASDHFRIIKDEGILPWIFAADILITDTSSVAYEFLPLNRPIVTYRATTRLDKGIDIMNPQELHGALIRSLEDPLEFNESRKNYLNDLHPYRDGKSSERIVKAISESLKRCLCLFGRTTHF